jgi:hypothetical protein
MLKVPPWLFAFSSLLLFIASSLANPLPSEFLGSWEAVDARNQTRSPDSSDNTGGRGDSLAWRELATAAGR